MKYAMAKFRVYLLGDRPFVVYTEHASLRTAVNSPHLSQRMARWLSFFAEYNFSVEYKPGRLIVVTDALLRRPDFEPGAQNNSEEKPPVAILTVSVPSSTLLDDIRKAYSEDKDLLQLIDHLVTPSRKSLKDVPALYRSSSDQYTNVTVCCIIQPLPATHLVSSSPLIMICSYALYTCHDVPPSGHRGRE